MHASFCRPRPPTGLWRLRLEDDLAGLRRVHLVLAVPAGLVVEPGPQHPGVLLVQDDAEGATGRIDLQGDERLPVTGPGDVGVHRARQAPETPVLDVEDPQAVTGPQAQCLGPRGLPL